MLAVGLMSGTSLDGIDAVLCEIKGVGINTKIEQLQFIEMPMPKKIKKKIQLACLNQMTTRDICSLNFELGTIFADAVKKVCAQAGIETKALDYIASHGQTIYHIPKANEELYRSSLQIGEPAVIAYECQCPVVSNFRTMDIAAGGQGAPLVPYSEWVLYSDQYYHRVLQNIGGIGNLTYLPAHGNFNDVMAFDTGPGNMMIDYACQQLFGLQYDDGGQIAAQGQLIDQMVEELKAHSYLTMPLPKTTGREMFGNDYTQELLDKYREYDAIDIIHTLTWFSAYSISSAYKTFLIEKGQFVDQVIIGGGGAYNQLLIQMIREQLSDFNIEVITQEALGYSSAAKEAIAFVIMGNETINRRPSNVPSATGAHHSVILGNVTYY